MSVTGVVKEVVYQKGGYCVLRLKRPKGSRPSAMVLCATNGTLSAATVGEELEVSGRMVVHERYGRQLAVERLERAVPPTESSGGAAALLSSGAFKGVGPKLAAALTTAFGDEVIGMIQSGDERLLAVPGVGPSRLEKLRASAERHFGAAGRHEALSFVLRLGLSGEQAQLVYDSLGVDARARLEADPYLLLSLLPGTAFPAVDRLALSQLGARLDSPRRAAAAIEACLRQSSSDGDCYAPRVLLLSAVQRSLSGPDFASGKALKLAQAALERMRKEGLVHADYPPPAQGGAGEAAEGAEAEGAGGGAGASLRDPSLAPYVYHQTLVREEEAVAMAVRRRLPAREQAGAGEAAGTGEAAGEAAGSGTEAAGLEHAFDERLSTAQREAVAQCAAMGADAAAHGKDGRLGRLLVLTGGPGTGKTFSVREVVRAWRQQGKHVMLACPTARAASVLSTSVGLPASTIHRLLDFNPQEKAFRRDKLNPLPADAVVIDEASMLDIHLAARFLEALREECVVLFVGDANQLPSVGPGAVLHDLLGSPRVPRVELSGIFRQDPTGDIARNAALINCGVVPSHWRRATAAQLDGILEPRPSGCLLVPARSAAEAQRLLCGDVLRWLRGVGYNLQEEVQVLSPVKRGPAGTVQLNQRLKGELNRRSRAAPPDGAAPDAATSDSEADVRVTIGDHVIQLKNDYDSQVFNGDSGVVCAVRPEGRSYSFVVEFDARKGPTPLGEESEPVRVVYPRSALGKTVSLAYALTVHKSQGSEYEVVCMPVLREPPHPYMLFRNLLYTGLSRAKRLLVVVGTEDAIANAVANQKAQARRTMLRQRISNDAFAPPTTRHL